MRCSSARPPRSARRAIGRSRAIFFRRSSRRASTAAATTPDRVWVHEDDARAAPYATDLLRGGEPTEIRERLLAIPLPGHTKGSVAYLLEDAYLFTGDSLAWSRERKDLVAFRDACWYSWSEQRKSLAKLAAHRFEWVLAGHGGSVHLPPDEMRARLDALVQRM